MAFELYEDGNAVVSRVNGERKDRAIGAFLDPITGDIQAGQRVQAIPVY
ncbi:MAG: hypothetical protein OXI87_13125 [Albidovulum sp.]|nr:hypothetical protein [Albidovulum sp.]MDE0534404.1 hypothetical protein [Albidovulum sp.]